MPNWSQVLDEIRGVKFNGPLDIIRQKYLKELAEYTGRNIITYYSGWLNVNPNSPGIAINDDDKNYFMSVIHGLDRNKGLDLFLHTPGGDLTATESLVDYLRQIFGINIRAIVPQLAMSAGAMISCACKEIIMGKQSSLGPIDPQLGTVSAYGVMQEFEQAIEEVKKDPSRLSMWQIIIGKYPPAFLGDCKRAISMSNDIVKNWLQTGMFKDEVNRKEKAERIVKNLLDLENNKTHARHIPINQCESIGLKVIKMEDDQKLQDLILTIHHTYMHTLSQLKLIKIVENQEDQRIMVASPS